jgi:ubiquinone biosynthesis protein UbiJ
VPEFLSLEWFETANASLGAATAPPVESALVVVLDLSDAPPSGPHALTLTLAPDGASLAPGDHLGADAVLRLAHADAAGLVAGELDSASALRDGRVKVAGDLSAVVALAEWLASARPSPAG